ncbi:MAG: hypothetical protein Q9183_005773, partial [Haloplaca sp. 2 TL-2023]
SPDEPTPLAISKRLTKIKASVNAGNPNTPNSKSKAGTGSAKATPSNRKIGARKAPNSTPTKKGGNAGGKRKRGADSDNNAQDSDETETSFDMKNNGTDASDSEAKPLPITKKPKLDRKDKLGTVGIKEENVEDEDVGVGKQDGNGAAATFMDAFTSAGLAGDMGNEV